MTILVYDNSRNDNASGDKAFGRFLRTYLGQPCAQDRDNKHAKE
jgi:hypothetical protein